MPGAFRPQVLVVDDDPAIREAMPAALQDLYLVHTASTGAEACMRLHTHPIAAIILDAILAGENGLDLVGEFRVLSPAPILLFTAHGSEELAAQAIWAHVDGYLKKPVDLGELRTVMSRLVPLPNCPADLAARARRHLDECPAKPFHAADLAG